MAGVLLAGAAAFYTARHLEFKTSRNDLIGRDSEYWRLYSEYAREFRAEEDYVVVVESDHPLRNKATIDALARALLASENNPSPRDPEGAQLFSHDDVFYRMNFDALMHRFLYFLSPAELTEIRSSVKDFGQLVTVLQQDPALTNFFGAMDQMFDQMSTSSDAERRRMEAFVPTISAIVNQMAVFDGSAEGEALLSPWANAFFSEETLGEAQQQLKWQGYNAFKSGKMFVLLVHPRAAGSGADDGTPHTATIPKLRRMMSEVKRQFPDVQISLTGEPVLDYDEMQVSQRDGGRATVLTLLLVGALFAVSFREVLRPLLALGCIVLVIALSMGYATLTVGHLNIITVTFAVMIVGLGIDLSIQFIARYEEDLARGVGREAAVRVAIEQTGRSIVTAGVTNAAAFFAMGLSGFKGVVELGKIAGGAMLIATAVTMLVLPAALLLAHRKRESTHIPARAAATRIENLLLRKPSVTLIVCGIITGGAFLAAWSSRFDYFDYNVLNLQSRGLESVDTELRLVNADVESTIFAAVVCDNFEQARALQHSLTNLPTVATVHSIVELIPEQQEEKMPLIREIQQGLGVVKFDVSPTEQIDAQPVLRALQSLQLRAHRQMQAATERGDTAAEKILRGLVSAIDQARQKLGEQDVAGTGKRLASYQRRFFADLQAQLDMMAGQIVDRPMTIDEVPIEARKVLVGKTGKLLIRVFPNENIWERDPLVRFVREVQSLAPKATGTPLGIYEFIDILQKGYRNAAVWAFFVIAVLIFIDFRGGYATSLTLLPLVVGMIWMVGAMALLGIRFNPANIMVLPLIVGIGVAYGIYVVQRYREDGEATFYGKSTGRAVMLSALMTILAFGSLIIGAHRGIRSLGLVMSIGVTACLIAAMALLPALLEIARRKGWKV